MDTVTKNFTLTLLSSKSPHEVFDIVKNVRSWWSGIYDETIEGSTDQLNEEFTFRAGKGAHYSRQKLVELVPDQKLVWLVTDSKLTFLKEPSEWTGSKIRFDISKQGDKTAVQFTHDGLTPAIECYKDCSSGWTKYLEGKLGPLIG